MKRIVHCTSVHRWDDVRIHHKMARALAAAGYDAHVVAIDREADAPRAFASGGATIHLLPGRSIAGRLQRVARGGLAVARKAATLDADVLHVHDPELLPFMLAMRRGKAKLVFDAHEDLRGQIASKGWIPGPFKAAFRGVARTLEWAARGGDGIVTATPHIAAKYGADSVVVQNFPLMEEFAGAVVPAGARSDRAVYTGIITRGRGIVQLVAAVGLVDELEGLELAGTFESDALRREVEALPGWRKVAYHGQVARPVLAELFGRASVGVVTFLPEPNHVNAQPTKLFEYMSAGLPVVVSDFPRWRALADGAGVAEFVDPADPQSVAGGLRTALARPPEERARLAGIARRLVEERYSFEAEFPKLAALYERLTA
ncbi:MAG: glycosyltransferase [Rhizobiaceae bacterium]|nr:glycosyltransferase [Rhizobiaceae bacterium]